MNEDFRPKIEFDDSSLAQEKMKEDDLHPKIPLEYSSPAQEQKREQEQERDRCEKINDYNLTTFGEAHPYLFPFVRRFAIYGVLILCAIFLPRWWPIRVTAAIVWTALAIWEYKLDS